MTGHKTRSVFERYNIVSECDLVEAAKKLNTLQPVPPASDRDGLAATKPRSGEVGHSGARSRSPPDSQSLHFFGNFGLPTEALNSLMRPTFALRATAGNLRLD